MKKIFIVANWKSNKDLPETEQWIHDFNKAFRKSTLTLDNKEIILSPSFTLLEHARYCLGNLKLPIKLAAQNISSFGAGPYTGEVSAKQIKEVAEYAIIGHSERRSNFYEDNKMINKKIIMARQYELASILCISDISQVQSSKFKVQSYLAKRDLASPDSSKFKITDKKLLIAYEPLFAIGSGQADTPKNAESMSKKIKEIVNDTPVLYGGSVVSDNVKSFTEMPNINGVLVGGASLNPLKFLEIIKNA